MGLAEGPATMFQWRWHYGIPSLPLWGLLGALLIAPKANRNWQAWLILILPLSVVGLEQFITLASGSSGLAGLGFVAFTMAVAWASVWLIAPWISSERRSVTTASAFVILVVVNAFGCLVLRSPHSPDEMTFVYFGSGVAYSLSLLLATSISGYYCRYDPDPSRALVWLLAWLPVSTIVCHLAFMLLGIWIQMGSGISVVLFLGILLFGLLGGGLTSLLLYLFNLPVMLIAQFSPLYRERFRLLFCSAESDELAFPPAVAWSPDDSPTAAQEGVRGKAPGDEEAGDEGECPFGMPRA